MKKIDAAVGVLERVLEIHGRRVVSEAMMLLGISNLEVEWMKEVNKNR